MPEELLKRQEALSARWEHGEVSIGERWRLEAHLREIRAKAARKVGVTDAADNAGQSAEEEKEDLSKLKVRRAPSAVRPQAELAGTRVDVKRLGRRARRGSQVNHGHGQVRGRHRPGGCEASDPRGAGSHRFKQTYS